jgi:hypothetical protein
MDCVVRDPMSFETGVLEYYVHCNKLSRSKTLRTVWVTLLIVRMRERPYFHAQFYAG